MSKLRIEITFDEHSTVKYMPVLNVENVQTASDAELVLDLIQFINKWRNEPLEYAADYSSLENNCPF